MAKGLVSTSASDDLKQVGESGRGQGRGGAVQVQVYLRGLALGWLQRPLSNQHSSHRSKPIMTDQLGMHTAPGGAFP